MDFVKRQEGYTPEATWDYKQYTVGYGTRAKHPNEKLDEAEATNRLAQELDEHAQNIDAAIASTGAKLTPQQRESLISFDFNTGQGAHVLEEGNGNFNDAADHMRMYVKAGKQTLPDLVQRRADELQWAGANPSAMPPVDAKALGMRELLADPNNAGLAAFNRAGSPAGVAALSAPAGNAETVAQATTIDPVDVQKDMLASIFTPPLKGVLPRPGGDGVGAGVVRGTEDVAESLVTPANIVLGGALGTASRPVQIAGAGFFGAQGANEATKQAIAAIDATTPGERAEDLTNAVAMGGLSVLPFAHLRGTATPVEAAAEVAHFDPSTAEPLAEPAPVALPPAAASAPASPGFDPSTATPIDPEPISAPAPAAPEVDPVVESTPVETMRPSASFDPSTAVPVEPEAEPAASTPEPIPAASTTFDPSTPQPVEESASIPTEPEPEPLPLDESAVPVYAGSGLGLYGEPVAAPDRFNLLQEMEREPSTFDPSTAEPVAEAQPAPVRKFKTRTVSDGFGTEITPVATALMDDLGGLLSEKDARKQGDYERNAELWDDAPTLAAKSHQAIYAKNGLMPDEAAQGLYEMGLLREPTHQAMWKALDQESKTAATIGEQQRVQNQQATEFNSMAKAFEKAALQPKKTKDAIPASALNVGDIVHVGTEPMKVTHIDPDTYDVTLHDGDKYGVQQVKDGEVIYGKHEPVAEANYGFSDGPGAAHISEFPAPSVTGIKNELVDKEREARGLPPRMAPLRRAYGTAWDEAMATMDRDPAAGTNLVNELNAKPRALTDTESAILAHEQLDRQNDFDRAVDRMNHVTTESERAEAQVGLDRARQQLQELYDAGQAAGTQSGRSLAARKILVQSDYSLARMEATMRAVANGGKALSEKQLAEVKAAHDKIAELQRKVDEYEAKANDVQLRHYFDQLVTETKRAATMAAKKGGTTRSFIAEQAAKARERLKARGGTLNVGINPMDLADYAIIGADYLARGVDFASNMVKQFGEKIQPYLPEILARARQYHAHMAQHFEGAKAETPADIVAKLPKGGNLDPQTIYELARAHVRAGVEGMDNVMKAVHADLAPLHEGLTEREVRDAFSGYGKTTTPSREKDLVALREYRRLAQLVSAIEDAQRKQAPKKTGMQRDQPTQAIRDKMKELQAVMREHGIETTSPEKQLASTNQARLTSLKNQIADLDRQLQTGEKPAQPKPIPDSPEVEKLRSMRDAMREHLREMQRAADPGKSPEDRALETALKRTEKAIANYDEMLKTGNLAPTARTSKIPANDHLEDLRSLRDALRDTVAQMRRDETPRIPKEEQARKAAVTALEKSLAEYDRRLQAGDFTPRPMKPGLAANHPQVEALRSQRDAMKRLFEELRRAEKTTKSPEEMRLARYKTSIKKRTEELQRRLNEGDYSKRPPVTTTLDAEAQRLKVEHQRAKDAYDRAVEKQRLANRPRLQKMVDAFVRWERAFKLSSPLTLGKLAAAAVTRTITTPMEEAVGQILHAAIPGVSKLAPREGGGFSIEAESKAISKGLVEGIKQVPTILRTGRSDHDVMLGKRQLARYAAAEFLGSLHAALKAPAKEAEFARSLEKRTAFALSKGLDVSNPVIQTRLLTEAYQDANRAIFMQDNFATQAYQVLIHQLEKNKLAPKAAYFSARTLQFLMPIVKVPTNIVSETINYTAGLPIGAARLAMAMKKGIATLEPSQADLIMRNLKKGSLGAALLTLGFLNPKNVGGYYQPGQKKSENDVQYGGLRLWGVDIPRWLLHSPAMEAINLGATVRRISDQTTSRGTTKGLSEGIKAGIFGLTNEIPFIKSAGLTQALSSLGTEGDYQRGELAKNTLVPLGVQELAKAVDKKEASGKPVERKPKTTWEHIEMGIPWLRGNVPLK